LRGHYISTTWGRAGQFSLESSNSSYQHWACFVYLVMLYTANNLLCWFLIVIHDRRNTTFVLTLIFSYLFMYFMLNGNVTFGLVFVVLCCNSTYLSNKIQKGKTCYFEEQVISMLEFLIDNIFVLWN
jgi:hypothetical protein